MSDSEISLPEDTNLPAKLETEPNAARVDSELDDEPEGEFDAIIREILSVERAMFFERRNAKSERQRKVKEVIERHTNIGEA
jgi:hypothetical protein